MALSLVEPGTKRVFQGVDVSTWCVPAVQILELLQRMGSIGNYELTY